MRQRKLRQAICLLLVLAVASCRKTDFIPSGSASLTVVNAVVGTNSLVTNFGGTDSLNAYYLDARQLYYNVFQPGNEFSAYNGKQRLAIYNYPDTLPKSIPLFDLTLDLPIGSINSLFLTGTVEAPDTIFVRDNPDYFPISDSSMGIRFANLSPGSAPVSINIQGQTASAEVNSLAYKSISDFIKLPAASADSSYTFEFHDMSSGALIGTYLAEGINSNGADPNIPVNRWRYRNCTLALLGFPDSTGITPQAILLINNY